MISNTKIFLDKDVKDGSASGKYCDQVVSVIKSHLEELMNHIDVKNFNPYGLQKGAATHSISGTTLPPSILQLLAGENGVLEVY